MSKVNLFWFRRDLRLDDNAGLFHALNGPLPVVPIFIFDREILDELEDRKDRRVGFIHQAILRISDQLQKSGCQLDVRYGSPLEIFEQLSTEYEIETVITNHDYEPYAIGRDLQIKSILKEKGIDFTTYKDQVIFERNEIVKDSGQPYAVFTPYSRRWLAMLSKKSYAPYPSESLVNNFLKKNKETKIPSLKEMDFIETGKYPSPEKVNEEVLKHYDQTRNLPYLVGTSRLGVHLRFGTISIRKLVTKAVSLNNVYLKELIWREFFMQLIYQQPHLVKQACKKEFDNIKWRNNQTEFESWCQGNTGYPIVDAGMREMNETGFMHNRVRMVTASFLVKHLLIDWRWGESYFANKLLDYELSSNNGNWQWVTGCGCDASPYFRIFNPALQVKKFDPQLQYIRKWIPELDSFSYPLPIVDHDAARQRCLNAFKDALATVKN